MRKSLVSVIAASAAVGGCHAHHQDGGATASRTYQVGNFQQIEVAGPYDVDVRTGGSPGVSAQGPEKLLERTDVTVEGNKLVIRSHRSGFFHMGFGSNRGAKFTVTVPQLTGASLVGSGDVRVDRIQGQDFEGSLAGSGDLSVGSMNVQSLKLSIAGSGDLKAGTGKAQSADYNIAGSGDLDASTVDVQEMQISVAGSGGVHAHGSGSAQVSIMGSGDVDITGGAKCQISKAGSGDVHCS